jgi:hypothetical protein
VNAYLGKAHETEDEAGYSDDDHRVEPGIVNPDGIVGSIVLLIHDCLDVLAIFGT